VDTVVVRVPATIANLGPGFDSIGLALAWHNEVRIERRDDEVLVVTAVGSRAESIPKDASNLVLRAVEMVMGEIPALQLNQVLAIPMGRGFGSSAAAVVAGLIAGRSLGGTSHTDDDLLELAVRLEGHADNVAPCLLGGITVSTEQHTVRLDPPTSIKPLVCVAPGAMSTKHARAALARDVSRAGAVANIGRAALLVAAIAQGRNDVLMDATDDLLHQPQRFELMPESGELVHALRGKGIAAFLAGAGPSVAALVDEATGTDAEVAARALAPDGWEVRLESIDPTGARVVAER
jgi:homoserine kinase